jgi:ABC-type multidrug transport system fused ATPase/permease subunit
MSDSVSQIFDRYLDQPPTLPVALRRRVEHASEGEIIQLYALADLDASLRLCQIWVTLTPNYLAVIRAVLIVLDWRLGLVMTVPLPILLFLIYRNGRTMHFFFLRAWRKWSNLTDALSDVVPGIRVVKAFDQAEHEKRRFSQRNEDFTDECFRIHHVWTGFWPILMLLVHSMTILTWAFALPRLLANGIPDLSTGTFVAFLLYMSMYFYPIEIIGQMARLLNRALSSAHRIFDLLDTEPQLTEREDGVKLAPLRGEIEFREVTFGYDAVRQIIKGVSFRIEAGELVGLVGPSGSGKTTLANLLVRFFDVTGGRDSDRWSTPPRTGARSFPAPGRNGPSGPVLIPRHNHRQYPLRCSRGSLKRCDFRLPSS